MCGDVVHAMNDWVIRKTGTNLDDILGRIGARQQMSTVDKTRKDWADFKQREGIEDDLRFATKDG